MRSFFDTLALIKKYIDEIGSDRKLYKAAQKELSDKETVYI
jgi:hypothetical protein